MIRMRWEQGILAHFMNSNKTGQGSIQFLYPSDIETAIISRRVKNTRDDIAFSKELRQSRICNKFIHYALNHHAKQSEGGILICDGKISTNIEHRNRVGNY